MNLFRINLVITLVVVDRVCICPIFRYLLHYYSLLHYLHLSQNILGIFLFSIHLLLTTTNLSFSQVSTSPCTPFDKIKTYDFTDNSDTTSLTSNHAICDPNHPVAEPNFTSSDGIFDE